MKKMIMILAASFLTLSMFGQVNLKDIMNKDFLILSKNSNGIPRTDAQAVKIFHTMSNGKHKILVTFPELSKEPWVFVEEDAETLKDLNKNVVTYEETTSTFNSLTYLMATKDNPEEGAGISITCSEGKLFSIHAKWYGSQFKLKDLELVK